MEKIFNYNQILIKSQYQIFPRIKIDMGCSLRKNKQDTCNKLVFQMDYQELTTQNGNPDSNRQTITPLDPNYSLGKFFKSSQGYQGVCTSQSQNCLPTFQQYIQTNGRNMKRGIIFDSQTNLKTALSHQSSPEKPMSMEQKSILKVSTIMTPQKTSKSLKRVSFEQNKYLLSHLLGKERRKKNITMEQLQRIF
ncbi:hypothetical protein pb186bvf_012280 [Paramecium bursaria]